MQYPEKLTPNSIEIFVIDDEKIKIPKTEVDFKLWKGEPLKNNFGGKPFLDFNGKPFFAELVILNLFLENNWNARWIETYGKPKLNPIHLLNWIDDSFKNQIHNPIDNNILQFLLNGIAKNNNNSYSGCWDVVAWNNNNLIFIESKRSKKDFVQSTQNIWLKSSLEFGLKLENFLIVEWKGI